MLNSPEFLIADIMPACEVHLLCGPSGAGKSTLLLQILSQWQSGQDVFGHKSFPVPYTYISCDRSRASVARTLGRLSLGTCITNIVTLEDLPKVHTLETIHSVVQSQYPDTQLLIIEAIQTFIGNNNREYGSASAFLKAATAFCRAKDLTIWGTGHSPKTKENERYAHPRERALGSVAWGGFSDLIITIDLDEKTRVRTVSVLPRNAAEEQHDFMSGPNGFLVPCPREKGERLMLVVLAFSEGVQVTTKQILELAENMEISQPVAERVIKRCVEDGTLERLEEGVYKRPFVS